MGQLATYALLTKNALRKQTVSAVAHFSESRIFSESLEDESERYTCGVLDAGRRGHYWSCPLNYRNIGKSSDEISKKESIAQIADKIS